MQAIDAIIEEAIQNNRIHGAQVGIYQRDCVLFEQNYVDAPDTIYRLYSMTKPVTAAAVMTLFEKGKLDLLEPVSTFLPEFGKMWIHTPHGVVECGKPITVRDLLNMTSGICYPDEDGPGRLMQQQFDKIQAKVETEEAYTTREVVRMIAAQPLTFEPGTAWRYGLSADVLGAVVEVITGKSYREYLMEEILLPLGMEDTDFYVPEEKRGRLSELYTIADGRLIPETKRHLGLSYGSRIPAFQSGGAGLFSTLKDYSRFARMLACEGTLEGVRILSRRTVRYFTQDQMEGIDQSRFLSHMGGYGFANLMRVQKNAASGTTSPKGEFGWDGWAGPYFSVDLEDGLSLVTMVQTTGFTDFGMNRRLKAVAATMV